MLKFRYSYLNNSLAIQKENDIWLEIPETNQFTGNFGSQGFKLGSSLDSGRIAFTVYENQIRAYYKYRQAPWKIIRYLKTLPKECPLIFTFEEKDEIVKVNGKWARRKHD